MIPFIALGVGRETTPSARQRQLARLMIDHGADAVVGGHPHVTQGAETYRGKPIIYSLGNFVFDGFDRPAEKTRLAAAHDADPPRRGALGHRGGGYGRRRHSASGSTKPRRAAWLAMPGWHACLNGARIAQ